MKITVEGEAKLKVPIAFKAGEVYREGRAGNYHLILPDQKNCIDLGAASHGYLKGPVLISSLDQDMLIRVPSGSKLTFEVV